MKIVYDQHKNATNIAKHYGMDFAALTPDFFMQAVILDAKRGRFNAVGELDGMVVSVIFKPLGTQGLSVISMRRASRKERAIYDQS